MNWHILVAIFVAGIVASFTDWFFFGVLFHDRYMKYPETWWPRSGPESERGTILWSTLLGFITVAAVVVLCIYAGAHDIESALVVAALAAVAGPLVTTITNGLWVRIDSSVTLAHTVGYIVRFLIAGVAGGVALSWP